MDQKNQSHAPVNIAAFLPARGFSQRIPDKSTMLLDGEPRLLRSLKKRLAIAGGIRADERARPFVLF